LQRLPPEIGSLGFPPYIGRISETGLGAFGLTLI
jgi:hypothetical protein